VVGGWIASTLLVKTRVLAKRLDADTLAELQRCYLQILRGSGYGTIKLRVERAGEKNESHIVMLEVEHKVR
jgi:hypothetical protein